MFVLQKIPTPPNPKCALNDVFVWKTSGSDWTHWWGTSSIGSTLVVEDSGLKKKWALAEVFLELERSCQSVQNGANINIYIYTYYISYDYIKVLCLYKLDGSKSLSDWTKRSCCTFFGVQFTGQLTGSMLSNGFCGKHHGYSEMTLWIPEWKR